jgi:hypothetical protein
MAREWEFTPVVKYDQDDETNNFYIRYNKMNEERIARRFIPDLYYAEYDQRSGDARFFKTAKQRYTTQIIKQRNSYKGMYNRGANDVDRVG